MSTSVKELVARAKSQIRNLSVAEFASEIDNGDVKLIDKSFKELRYALKVFSPYRDVRKVSIFGSARTPESHPDYRQAADFGVAFDA